MESPLLERIKSLTFTRVETEEWNNEVEKILTTIVRVMEKRGLFESVERS